MDTILLQKLYFRYEMYKHNEKLILRYLQLFVVKGSAANKS